MQQVMAANLFGDLGSLGDGAYVLLRQFKFPDTYGEKDELHSADHDRCYSWDYDNTKRCFDRHVKGSFETWIKTAQPKHVLAFLVDILKLSQETKWTGFRVMGTVNRSNGYPVYTFEVFKKHPESKTKVYSDDKAPNVTYNVTRRLEDNDTTPYDLSRWIIRSRR